jgi:acyl-CoA synthetase (AMP-forming)/AMP-acid ligase II
MIMPIELKIPAEAEMSERADGSLLLQNKIALADYPANLAEWLRQNAARFPDKPFLQERNDDGGWQAITYSETLAQVNQISNGLLTLDLEPQAPIAILSPNCINMALIQLAAMQIGHPVVPISYAYSVRSQTGSLIKHILDVTAASVLVMSDAKLHMGKVGQWERNGRHASRKPGIYGVRSIQLMGERLCEICCGREEQSQVGVRQRPFPVKNSVIASATWINSAARCCPSWLIMT